MLIHHSQPHEATVVITEITKLIISELPYKIPYRYSHCFCTYLALWFGHCTQHGCVLNPYTFIQNSNPRVSPSNRTNTRNHKDYSTSILVPIFFFAFLKTQKKVKDHTILFFFSPDTAATGHGGDVSDADRHTDKGQRHRQGQEQRQRQVGGAQADIAASPSAGYSTD